jgi:hypothetical protein
VICACKRPYPDRRNARRVSRVCAGSLLQVTEENRGANSARLSTARLNEKAADIVFGEKNSNEIWGILSSWKLDLLDSARGVMINQIHKIQFSYEEY